MKRGRKKVRLDLLLSCLVGGVIGLGIPRRVIGWIKRECGIEGAPRHDEAETAAKQKGDAEDTSEVKGSCVRDRKCEGE